MDKSSGEQSCDPHEYSLSKILILDTTYGIKSLPKIFISESEIL